MLLSPALALSVLTQVNLHCNKFEIFPYTVASYIHYIVANSLGILTVCFLQHMCLTNLSAWLAVFFSFSVFQLKHVYECCSNGCSDFTCFLADQLHLGFSRGSTILTVTHVPQQNSLHTSSYTCAWTQGDDIVQTGYIQKSLFQGLPSPPQVFFLVGKFMKELESHLPQTKALPIQGLRQ